MAGFDKRHGKGKRGPHITRGVAKASGAATFGVSSDAEMSAKAPPGGAILNNFVTNPLYDADARYPGAGSKAATWAGFTCTDRDFNRGETAFYPIRISASTDETDNITLEGAVPSGQTLTVRVAFFSGGGTVYRGARDFTFTETTQTVKTASTAGLPHVDYDLIKFEFINPSDSTDNGGTFYFGNFFIDHDIDVSMTGEQNAFGGAYISGAIWSIPRNPYGHTNPQMSINGNGSSWIYNKMPAGWKHYNSLYISDTSGEWDTYIRKKFLRHKKFNNEYLDIAAENPSANDGNQNAIIVSNGYEIPEDKFRPQHGGTRPNQRRIIELTGTNGRGTDSRTLDWSPPEGVTHPIDRGVYRSYPDIAMFGLVKSALVEDRATARSGNNTISNVNGWVKQSAVQSIYIPNSPVKAHYCKYGAYVQAPANKLFRNGKNFGAIQVSQDRGGGYEDSPNAANNEREVYGDSIWFVNKVQRIAGFFPNQTINMLGGFDSPDNTRFTQYNWNGLAATYQATASAVDSNQSPIIKAQNNVVAGHSWPSGYRYPTLLNVTGVTYDDTPYREFKLVERTWYGKDGNGLLHKSDMSPGHANAVQHQKQIPYILFELNFYEPSDNLGSLSFDGTGAGGNNRSPGAIRFFCPYIQFFGENDTPIASG